MELLLLICFYIGKLYGVHLSAEYVKSLLIKDGIKHVNIIITKDFDNYLVHSVETNEFIAQGKTRAEVLETLAVRFPLTNFMVDKSNLKEVGFINDSI